MICPHCQAGLRRRERTDRRCGVCGGRFALDPKDNALGLHDLRLRRLAGELSDGGRLAYTVEQLWYASARKTLRRDIRRPPAAEMAVVVERWAEVYGSPPPGMVHGDQVALPAAPDQPVMALLCMDRAVLMCLAANQVPQRLRLAVSDPTALPPDVPVALLHDVSVAGYRWAVAVRARLIGRQVMDLGPRPATAMQPGAAPLRDEPPPPDEIAELRTAGALQPPELDWLGDGWWSPLAAVPPATVIAWVEAAAERVDPDHRAAAAVGFLSWPSPGRQPSA